MENQQRQMTEEKRLAVLQTYYGVIEKLITKFILEAGAKPQDVDVNHNIEDPWTAIITYKREPQYELRVDEPEKIREHTTAVGISLTFLDPEAAGELVGQTFVKEYDLNAEDYDIPGIPRGTIN